MTPLDILLYIAVWTLYVNALSYAFTGKLPHDFIPAVKARKRRLELEAAAAEEEETWRRQALASLKKEDIAFLTAGSHWTPPSEVQYRIDLDKKNEQYAQMQQTRADRYREQYEHEQKQRQLLKERQQRQIERAATIPSVPERLSKSRKADPFGGTRMKSADYWARETERSRQKEIAAQKAMQARIIEAMITKYTALGVPYDTINVADRAEPVAVIPAPPKIDSITRTTQYGHEIQITHYSDGSMLREHVKKSRADHYLD